MVLLMSYGHSSTEKGREIIPGHNAQLPKIIEGDSIQIGLLKEFEDNKIELLKKIRIINNHLTEAAGTYEKRRLELSQVKIIFFIGREKKLYQTNNLI